MFQINFHQEASKEYEEAFIWYELQSEGLGERFRKAISHTLQKLEKNPQFFGFSKRPFREISVDIFPYAIVYYINKKKKEVSVS